MKNRVRVQVRHVMPGTMRWTVCSGKKGLWGLNMRGWLRVFNFLYVSEKRGTKSHCSTHKLLISKIVMRWEKDCFRLPSKLQLRKTWFTTCMAATTGKLEVMPRKGSHYSWCVSPCKHANNNHVLYFDLLINWKD